MAWEIGLGEQGRTGARMAGHDTASHAHDTTKGGHDTVGSAMSRYNKNYRDRSQLGCWVVSRCSTQQRCDTAHGATIRAAQRTRHNSDTIA